MIVAERKSLEKIYALAKRHKRILLLGCGTCVTVCMAGGEKEVGILASQLTLKGREEGLELEILQHTITRQCDREFFDEAAQAGLVAQAEAVISLACGVGVQFCAECYPDKIVYPATDTKFYGATVAQGTWEERCAGCGECMLDKFGGVCPIARCSKNLLNGPCGGSSNGRCEVNPEHTACAWQLIYERLERLHRLEDLEQIEPMKDWSKSRDGGPRRIIREDVQL